MKKEIFRSVSPEETEKIAMEIAARTNFGATIALHGELGAGKTVFAKGFAKGLGIKEAVTSPTFTIVQEYEFNEERREKKGKLYHIDLYRLETVFDAFVFGIEEIFRDPIGIILIEWAEKMEGNLPKETVHVRIETVSMAEDSERIIHISSYSSCQRER
jgi:tRNA threonylcarbamoyladenosine biosynthesis protein TsaE